jgi:hypothetical protein
MPPWCHFYFAPGLGGGRCYRTIDIAVEEAMCFDETIPAPYPIRRI